MTRNQLVPNVGNKLLGNAIFTVDGDGNITPEAMQYVSGSGTIVTQHKTGCGSQFGGHVCARQDDECQCPALVGVASGTHMAVGQGYTISSSVSSGSEFEIYALSGSDPVPNTTNGSIHVGD